MNCYLVIQKGVYRHAVIGLYSDTQSAINAALAAVESEPDHYHDAEVIRLSLDSTDSELLGAAEANWLWLGDNPLKPAYQGALWHPSHDNQ